jgi:hypothetical protein
LVRRKVNNLTGFELAVYCKEQGIGKEVILKIVELANTAVQAEKEKALRDLVEDLKQQKADFSDQCGGGWSSVIGELTDQDSDLPKIIDACLARALGEPN